MFFSDQFIWIQFFSHNIYSFVQDNVSYSAEAGTIRGLHFQKNEYAQANYKYVLSICLNAFYTLGLRTQYLKSKKQYKQESEINDILQSNRKNNIIRRKYKTKLKTK